MSTDESTQVAVVGAGQAGLSMSWLLGDAGIDHVVLERDTVAHEWQDRRWETFCLVTPNWQCQLPGYGYDGADPDGFMLRDEIVHWLRAYAGSFALPVREHTAVSSLDRGGNGFVLTLHSPDGASTLRADQVVIATGGYHRGHIPALAQAFAPDTPQLHSSAYVGPAQFPGGPVLVIGTGQSGAQIAEDLHLAGRAVHLAVGSAPRVARRYRGRDVVAWLQDMGHYDKSAAELGNDARHDRTNHYVTGRGGGHDIDLRAFARDGMTLHGRLLAAGDGMLQFGDNLVADLDRADGVSESIKDAVDEHISSHGIDAPTEARYEPVWAPESAAPSRVALTDVAAVIWATGYQRDDGWNRLPCFDGTGHPVHDRGVSPVEGLYFLGLPWQHTWGSGRFAAVARDARHLAEHLVPRASRLAGPVPVAAHG